MHVVHLTASAAFGGPERQILGLAAALPDEFRTTIASFREGGRCRDFLGRAAAGGFTAVELTHDTPRLAAGVREIARLLADADVVLCHGYKAALLGRPAARRAGIPAVAVSRGWTWENWKVQAYTLADRLHLRCMDHVVCVSDGQARKVRRAGVPPNRVSVIRNSARLSAFAGDPDPAARGKLLAYFPAGADIRRVVVAAGRFSPEKGFDVLLDAAAMALRADPHAGLVVFGDGDLRPLLEAQIARLNLAERVRLPGFIADLDHLLPAADIVALPSHSEGLPNVLLEAAAAGVPVVATRVGGVPEVVTDGETGLLVPPADPAALAAALGRLLADEPCQRRFGAAGRRAMHAGFTFAAQAAAYADLLGRLARRPLLAGVA